MRHTPQPTGVPLSNGEYASARTGVTGVLDNNSDLPGPLHNSISSRNFKLTTWKGGSAERSFIVLLCVVTFWRSTRYRMVSYKTGILCMKPRKDGLFQICGHRASSYQDVEPSAVGLVRYKLLSKVHDIAGNLRDCSKQILNLSIQCKSTNVPWLWSELSDVSVSKYLSFSIIQFRPFFRLLGDARDRLRRKQSSKQMRFSRLR